MSYCRCINNSIYMHMYVYNSDVITVGALTTVYTCISMLDSDGVVVHTFGECHTGLWAFVIKLKLLVCLQYIVAASHLPSLPWS